MKSFSGLRNPGSISQDKSIKNIPRPKHVRILFFKESSSNLGKIMQVVEKYEIVIKNKSRIKVVGVFFVFFRGGFSMNKSFQNFVFSI